MNYGKIKLYLQCFYVNDDVYIMDNLQTINTTGRVLLIYTGGTIGMGINRQTNALEPLDFNHLVSNLPEMKYLSINVDVYQFENPIDSSDMAPEVWTRLAGIIANRYQTYDGFVVLHGTDTMAYTASALSFMLENLTKPVILTGSQLPIGHLRTDAKENLISSIDLASAKHEDGTPIVPEVCIYFNGRLLRGNRTTKQNADGFNAFDSFNYPHLCEVGIRFQFSSHHILKPDYTKPMVPHYDLNPNIMVLSLFPGIQANIFEHALDAPELKGVVMRSFGSGNAPQQAWLIETLKKASQRGVSIVNISQCVTGFVEMGRYDTGYQLKGTGVISGQDCTVEAAVTKLMYLYGRYGDDTKTIRELLSIPLAGEFQI